MMCLSAMLARAWRGLRGLAARAGLAALVALALLLGAAPQGARAVQPDELLPDPVLEARARDISAGLRCVVCRNESIDESNAELARDLRLLVRERLVRQKLEAVAAVLAAAPPAGADVAALGAAIAAELDAAARAPRPWEAVAAEAGLAPELVAALSQAADARLAAGESDADVVAFIVDRYGEYVLLRPRLSGVNLALWAAGPVLLLLGLGLAAGYLRRRAAAPAPAEAALSPEEEARLRALLAEDRPGA